MRVRMTRNTGATDYWRFPWSRCGGGYELRRRERDDLWPVPVIYLSWPQNYSGPTDVYFPLEEAPGISREFAAIRTQDECLEFAGKYGLLGLVSRSAEELDMYGEPVSNWLTEARSLRRVYEVWDLIAAGDERQLRAIVRWLDQSAVTACFPEGKTCIADQARNTSWLATWKTGETLGPAKLFIVNAYNRAMDQMASPMLLLNAKGELRPYNAPSSLLGALWLEFGQIVTGARRQIPCESCGKLMDVTENRKHKRKHSVCAHREKMARYRSTQ